MKYCENTLTVPFIKDVPQSINGFNKIAIVDKNTFEGDFLHLVKGAKEYYKLKTLILNVDEDVQVKNYGALYVKF